MGMGKTKKIKMKIVSVAQLHFLCVFLCKVKLWTVNLKGLHFDKELLEFWAQSYFFNQKGDDEVSLFSALYEDGRAGM